MSRPFMLLRRGALVAAMVTTAVTSTARAQAPTPAGPKAPDQRERYAPLVLKLPATARVLSLGGARVALRDADAVFGNPALVGTATALAVGAERYASGATAGQFASSSTIGPLGIGVGVHMLDAAPSSGVFPAASEVLTRATVPGTSSLAASVAASLTWKQLRWGVAATYLNERVADDQARGVAFDLGASKSLPFLGSTVGVAVQHLGSRLAVAGRRAALPTQLALGIATAPRGIGAWVDVAGTAELDVRRDGALYPRGGVEVSYVPIEGVSFTGRVGGRRPQLRAEQPFTAGGGITVDRVTLDYGWETLREGAGHRLTLRLR
jgi:hypothetical protein